MYNPNYIDDNIVVNVYFYISDYLAMILDIILILSIIDEMFNSKCAIYISWTGHFSCLLSANSNPKKKKLVRYKPT